MRGYYLMHRGWLDHPALGGSREPHNRRSAWAWLIENAAYQDREIMVGGKERRVARGQLYLSMRSLGREWGWAEPKVRRFFQATQACQMTECVTDAHGSLITICNYEKYQDITRVTDAPTDAHATHQPTHILKKIKEGKEDSPDGESTPPKVPPHPGGDAKVQTKTRRQAKRIAPEWMPSAEGRSFAAQLGLDPQAVADEFRDYWIGDGGTKADWDATFRNRCRQLAERGRGNATGPKANGHHYPTPAATQLEGFYLASEKFIRDQGDSCPDRQADEPLLDRGRAGGGAPSPGRGLARRPH